MLRASQTADIIGEQLNLDVHLEKGLRELNTGVAIGKTKEWSKKHTNPLKNNILDMDHRLFDEGESWGEFYNRVSDTMNKILKKENGNNLIIVTHGGTLGYIVAWWLEFDPQMLNKAHFQADVGAITKLGQNNLKQNTLIKFSDTSHL